MSLWREFRSAHALYPEMPTVLAAPIFFSAVAAGAAARRCGGTIVLVADHLLRTPVPPVQPPRRAADYETGGDHRARFVREAA